jgi:hypothetical protein
MKQTYSLNYRFLLPFLVLVTLLSSNNSNAQCGPYQAFESFNNSTLLSALQEGTSGGTWNQAFTSRPASPYSGLYALSLNAASSYLITPKIARIQNFSFYYRAASTATAAGFKVQYSTNFNGTSAGVATATWIDVNSVSTTIVPNSNLASQTYTSATYSLFTIDLSGINNSAGGGIYVRISDNRLSGGVVSYIDDLSWTSTTASENLEIVMPKSTSSTCTQNILSGLTYIIYDNGGYADTYNGSQTNTVTIVPPAGYNANFSMASATTVLSPTTPASFCPATVGIQDELLIYNGDASGTQVNWYQNGCASHTLPASVLSSDCLGRLTAKLYSDATANVLSSFGVKISVTTTLAAACSDVAAVVVTAGSASFDGATVTWTAPCPVPLNYDYYVSTSSSPPANNVANETGTVSGASPTATITGLTSGNTPYYVWIRSHCSAGVYGNWVSPGTGPHFTTLCSPYSVPYLEDFNGLNGPLPLCTRTNTTNGIWKTNLTNGNLYASSASAVNTMFYTRPLSLVAGTTYRVSYDYSSSGGTSPTSNFDVYYGTALTAPSATNVTTLLASHPGASGITSNVVNFTAPSTGIFYIGFKLTSLSNPATTFFNLDNVSVDVETCFPPTVVGHANETQTSSDISFTPPVSTPSNGYQYSVSTDSTTPNYNVPPSGTATGSPVTVGSLTPGTTYYLWVRSNCGGKYSIWSAYTTFTTVAAPAADVIILPTGTNGIATCNALFYDGGGAATNYAVAPGGFGNYLTSTYTIAPGVVGQQIKVVFSSFSTENNYDGLMIYDGASVSPALLMSSGAPAGTDTFSCPAGAYSGTRSPGTIYSTNGNGLTFVFKSDYLISSSGWAATVSCVTLPKIISFTPTGNSCGGTGTVVTITGDKFTAAPITSVMFNGTAATYTVVNNTTINATLPAGATTGPITVSNAQATSTSTTAFQVLGAAPTVSADVSVCPGNTTTFTSSFNCTGYGNSGLTYAGTWSASGPSAPKPTSSGNSSTCAFTTTQMPYVSTTFQVSVTGTYVFSMTDYATYDAMAYITTGAFVAGSCGSGTLIKVDDDSGAGFQPQITAVLTQGITYTLYTTVYSNPGGTFAFDYTITPPTGGELMLLTNTINWYDSAAGTTVLAQGNSFDPVGSGAVNPYTPGPYTFYAACASNTTCRTPFTFTIKAPPALTLTAGGNVCANKVKALTVTGAATTFSWSSAANTLFTDALGTIPYAGENLTTVYVKTNADVTVTVVGTDSSTTCDTTISSTQKISTKTWSSGSWSGNGFVPTSGETIAINSSGTFTNLGGCSCTVGAGANVVITGTMTLDGDLGVAPSATMTFNDDASLVQIDTPASNTNTGNILYKRNTAMRKMDYTYWSSPVQAQYLYQSSATPLFLDGVGAPLPTQTDKYYWFDTSINNWAAPTPAAPVSATTMTVGRGYIIRAPLTVDPYTAQLVTATFTGKPNNGNYSVNIFKGAGDMNCIGNPYPSALSANLFISQNTAAFGSGPTSGTSLYFWTHNTPLTNNAYTFSDYAVYNYTGGTVSTSGATPVPNGKIAAGQAFMVKGVIAGTTTANFKNSMRLSGVNDNTFFYRNNSATAADDAVASLERNRIWLDMTNDSGFFKQILVGYIENATDNFDSGFDGEIIEAGNTISFYSLLADKKMSVQGKALPFADTDTVPLGYKSAVAGSYTIALSQFDSLFADQTVYLEDIQLNTIHSLTQSPYTFVTDPGTFDNRFVLRYINNLLSVSNPVFSANAVIVVKQHSGIHVQTSAVKMKAVQIYDARGRLIAENQHVDSNSVSFENLNFANQMLIVNITSEDGVVVNKKIIF